MTGYRLRCRCGDVECAASGAPICVAVCYCDDCQAAAHAIEGLPGAAPVADADGGTMLALFDSKRFAVERGADRLVAHRLKPDSTTRRMVAGCCNSAMYLDFDSGAYWVSVFGNRLVGAPPRIEYRLMTKYRASALPWPDEAARSKGFPPRLLLLRMLTRAVTRLVQ